MRIRPRGPSTVAGASDRLTATSTRSPRHQAHTPGGDCTATEAPWRSSGMADRSEITSRQNDSTDVVSWRWLATLHSEAFPIGSHGVAPVAEKPPP